MHQTIFEPGKEFPDEGLGKKNVRTNRFITLAFSSLIAIPTYAQVAALAVGFGLAAIPASALEDSVCSGVLPAGTYNNVHVPKNASCTLNSSVTI
jgi:hypothetical protein